MAWDVQCAFLCSAMLSLQTNVSLDCAGLVVLAVSQTDVWGQDKELEHVEVKHWVFGRVLRVCCFR